MTSSTQRWHRRLAGAFLAGLLAAPACAAETSEYDAKAAYVINFARYVTWPAAEPADAATPFQMCVLGHATLSVTLERALAGRSLNGRTMALRRVRQLADAPGCQLILFLQSEERSQPEWLVALEGKPVLTVGESGGFLRDGGMIKLVIVRGSVRFEVNLEAAKRAGLSISSRMLSVAEAVYGTN